MKTLNFIYIWFLLFYNSKRYFTCSCLLSKM
jgi:hypothetical protein